MKPPNKKKQITEFASIDDFIMSMILVAFAHANPDMDMDEVMAEARKFVRVLYMPRMSHVWKRQRSRLDRFGIRCEASKIRREMYKLI